MGDLIEVARLEDVEILLAIEKECSSHPWTREHLAEAVGRAAAARATLIARGEVEGQPGIVGYCAFQVVLDELHVHNLAVRPAARRQGYARRLLIACLHEGASRGARRAFLEVRAGNRGALALYRSCGFVEVGRRRAYYAQPTEDAALLQRADLADPARSLRSR